MAILPPAVSPITAGQPRKANLMVTGGGAAGELAWLKPGEIQRAVRLRMLVEEEMRGLFSEVLILTFSQHISCIIN